MAKRVNMYQISTQAFFLKLTIVINTDRIILVIIFIFHSVSILNFSSESFFREKLERYSYEISLRAILEFTIYKGWRYNEKVGDV